MDEYAFEATGTTWRISVAGEVFSERDRKAVQALVDEFEQRFSRFIDSSEVNSFRAAVAGKYEVSEQLAEMLAEAVWLRSLTEGVYDPASGVLLEKAGYDAAYRFTPSEDVGAVDVPQWSIEGRELLLEGPTAFDLGSIGKGYCIDLVARQMEELGYQYFAVEAGGDMYVTQKPGGGPWKVAIQYPGREDTAAGVVELDHQALAVSDSFRRRWGAWHHIVDAKKKTPVAEIIGAAAVAPSAFYADCMTSALFLAPSGRYREAARHCGASYLVFKSDETWLVAPDWKGELFTG